MSSSVLMLGWEYGPEKDGGLDVYVARLFDGLREAGIDVTLVVPAENAVDEPDVVSVPTGDGDVATRAGRLGDRFADLAASYDIAHTNDWFGFEPGLKAKLDAGTAWVSTMHSLCTDRSLQPPESQRALEQQVIDRADLIIAVSNALADQIREENDREVSVVHNGFSRLETSSRDVKAELEIDDSMVLYVGRHAEQKGLTHLLYAFRKLRHRRDATLVVAGTGPMTEQLQMFANLLDIAEDVAFVGYVPDGELGDYYASADVFVSPSLSEPFGLTITEALEAGTRVVATDSGVMEVLPDDAVVTVEPDSDSIAAGIQEALDIDEQPDFERRSWDECVEETIALYEQVS